MRLFISNFKQETPVLGFVGLLLVAIEISLRAAGTHLSLDLRHIREIPHIVSALRTAAPPAWLFIGNSLVRRGVDPDVLAAELASHGITDVHLAMLHPDDTNIADWHYLYEHRVRSAGWAPDQVLVGFAEDQLSDTQRLHIDLLGGYLGGIGALPEVFRYDAQDLPSRMGYLLASFSCAYANRDRVRTQLLGAIIPDYKSSAQVINNAVKVHPAGPGNSASGYYQRLTRFLDLFKDTPTPVVFIAIPLPKIYPLDPALPLLLNARGVRLIDLRHIEGLTDRDFLDGYHLSPQGAVVFSRELTRKLLKNER